jgi:hypothetical protein
MIALGCFIAYKHTVNFKTVLGVFRDVAPKDKSELIEINQRALEEGMNLR